jgi:hypothetical protein
VFLIKGVIPRAIVATLKPRFQATKQIDEEKARSGKSRTQCRMLYWYGIERQRKKQESLLLLS